MNTDFDGDGCQDSFEDEDDDGDGVANPNDACPSSTGPVDEDGCSAAQNIDENQGGSGSTTTVYYVCQQGSLVVTDLSDCPDQLMKQTHLIRIPMSLNFSLFAPAELL